MNLITCNTNSLCHIDYGKPLFPKKQTDYRTSTGFYHGYRPENPQNFDCRFKANISAKLKIKNVQIKDNMYKSSYNDQFTYKLDSNPTKYFNAARLDGINYIQNVEEKLLRKPPCNLSPKLSEVKDSYKTHQLPFSPAISTRLNTKCELVSLGRDEQPCITPESPSYWKYLDIYLTQNRSDYIPYNKEQIKQSGDDLITYYNLYGLYKGLKDVTLPPRTGNKAIYDKMLFKYECLPRCLSRAPKYIPNTLKSEMKLNYIDQSSSKLFPHLKSLDGVEFNDSLPNCGPWQNLSPPAMYCTETCHIGTGWPINAVI